MHLSAMNVLCLSSDSKQVLRVYRERGTYSRGSRGFAGSGDIPTSFLEVSTSKSVFRKVLIPRGCEPIVYSFFQALAEMEIRRRSD